MRSKRAKKRTIRIVAILLIALLSLQAFRLFSVDAAQPTRQRNTGTYTGSVAAYATIGFSLMFDGITTSVSTEDDAVIYQADTKNPRYDKQFEIVELSNRERRARGSIPIRTVDGEEEYFNFDIVVTPPNFNSNRLVVGRSLVDNLYSESGVNKASLDGSLAKGGTAWINPIMSVRTSSGSHPTFDAGQLWSGGSSNYSAPSRVFSTDTLATRFGWSPRTKEVIPQMFDNKFTFPVIDDDPPTHVSSSVSASGSTYQESSNVLWVRPNADVSVRIRQRDTGSGNRYQHLRIYRDGRTGIAARSVHYFRNSSNTHQVRQVRNDNLIEINGARRATYNSGRDGQVTWNVVPKLENETYHLERRFEDVEGNNTSYNRFYTIKTDGIEPSFVSSNVSTNYSHNNVYWAQPNQNVAISVRGRDNQSGLNRSNVRLDGINNNADIRSRFYYDGSTLDNYRTDSRAPVNSASRTYESTPRRQIKEATFIVNPKNHGDRFNIRTWHQDQVGLNTGWEETGKELRVDGASPTHVSSTVSGERYRDGSTYWVRPGDTLSVSHTQEDLDSGNNRGYIRLNGNNQDVRYYHTFNSGTRNNFSAVRSDNSNTSSVRVENATRTQHNRVGRSTVNWDVRLNSHGHNYDLQYYFRDNVGNNRGYTTIGQARVDGTAPTMSVSRSTTNWTSGNVTLTVNASDSLSGVKRIRRPNGTWVNASSASYTVSSNGSYTFIAEDNVGNQRTQNVTVSNIDTTPPTIQFFPYQRDWRNSNVTVAPLVFDNGSGLASSRYRVQTNGSWGPWTSMGSENSVNISISSHGESKIQIESTDNAGNTATNTSGYYKIDKNAPSISFSPNERDWDNSDVRAYVEVIDTQSEIKSIKYQIETNGSWGSWVDKGFSGTNIDLFSWNFTSNGTRRIRIEAEDNAGNKRTVTSGYYRVDKQNPTVSLSPMSRGWDNTNVSVKATGSDSHSGVDAIRYQIETNGSWGNWTTWQSGSSTDINITSNGTHRIRVQSRDVAGNTSSIITSNYYRIDKTNPTVSLSPMNRDWDNTNVNIKLTSDDTYSNVKETRYRVRKNGSWGSWNNWVSGDSQNISLTSTGYYQIQAQSRDNAGNVSSIVTSNRYEVDKVNPTVSLSPMSRGWNNTNVNVTASASDSHSGVDAIRYRIETDGSWGSWSNWASGDRRNISLTDEGVYRIDVQSRDIAGNTSSTVRSNYYRIDKTKPTISFSPNGHDYHDEYDVNVRVNDARSGVDTVRYRLTETTSKPTSGWITGSTNFNVNIHEMGTFYLHVEATDVAGNTRYSRSNPLILFNEAPVLSKGWFTPNPAVIETDITVNLEIQDEENNDVDVELSILYPVDENGNREEHYIKDYNLTYNEQAGKYETMIYEFRPEVAGQYTMMAKLEDKYNEAVYSYTFTILDAGLTESFVEHTDGWETNRQMYNARFQEERKRDPGTFFAGEKFLLSTQTLNTTASGDPGNIGLGGQGLFGLNNGEVHLVDKVEVKLWEKNQSGQKVEIENMEGSDLVELDLTVEQNQSGQEVLVWKGEMWHESMMEWGDKDLIFEFIAHYNNNSPNSHIEKVEVNKVVRNENEYDIRIEGNDYFRLRKGH